MTIKEIYEQMDGFDDDKRATFLGGLSELLSEVSMQTLRDFQNKWDGSKDFEAFCEAQAKEFKACIELEIGPAGQAVRKAMGLEPLLWETEIAA